MIFCGVDTSICVETSLREAFNSGYDVIIVSDATASGIPKHYETTLERVRDYYGLVVDVERFYKMISALENIKSGQISGSQLSDAYGKFLKEFSLLDIRKEEN